MKKNKCSIQSIAFVRNVCVAFVSVVSLLAGCAGFTEDGNSFSETENSIHIDIKNQFALARVTREGNADIDESQGSLTFVYEKFGGCFNKDSAFVWDDTFYRVDSIKLFYSFQGDTLVLTDSTINHDTGLPTYTSMYLIGGSSGVLDGIWMLLPCHSFGGDYSCVTYGTVTTFIRINEGKVEVRSSDENFDYMSSGFMEYLFSVVSGGQDYATLSLSGLFSYSLSMNRFFTQDSFVVVSKTNKSMTFTHDGQSYTLNVVYASQSDSALVVLSSGEVSCEGYYRNEEYGSLELCREEFADYLYKHHLYSQDVDLWGYKHENYREFGSCIKQMRVRK